jgi:HEAT repeat protein
MMAATTATLAASCAVVIICATFLQGNALGQNVSAITTPIQTNGTDPKIEYYLAKKDWDSLAKMGQSAIPQLVAALSDNDESVRQGAIDALGQIGDRSAIEPLVAVLKDYGPYPSRRRSGDATRAHAAKSLVKLGYSPANADDKVALCFASVKWGGILPEYVESARGKDINDLESIGQEAVLPLCKIVRNLKEDGEMNRGDYREAACAAAVLGIIGSTNAVDTLIAVADGKDYVASGYRNVAPGYPLTTAAVTALGKIHDPKTLDSLIKLLDASGQDTLHHDVLKACARALGELGDTRAAAPLGKLLNQEYSAFEYGDTDYRSDVCDALVRFGSVSVDPLLTALKGSDKKLETGRYDETVSRHRVELRVMVAEALGKIGDKRAVQPLCELLNDKESQVRRAAVDALGKLKDQQAIDPLIGALKDSDSGVREGAAKALDDLGWKP